MTRHWGKVAAGLMLGGMITYACTTDTAIGPDVAIDSLYIEPGDTLIVLDDSLALTAIGVDSVGKRFVYSRAVWTTSNSEIELTSTGLVIALDTGTVTVSASAGTKTASVVITIQP